MFKYNIGDIVNVISKGNIYDNYTIKFRELSINNSKNPIDINSKYIILNTTYHHIYDTPLYHIKNNNTDDEYLIDEKGLKLYDSNIINIEVLNNIQLKLENLIFFKLQK